MASDDWLQRFKGPPKQYVCELCGKPCGLAIDWPGYCSLTCATLAVVHAKAPRPTPGNGRSHGQESDGEGR